MVLARIETKVNQHIYSTWFKPTSFVADDGHLLRIRVPNALFSNWLNKHYSVVLTEALTEVNRQGCLVSFVTEESQPERTKAAAAASSMTSRDAGAGRNHRRPPWQSRASLFLRRFHRRTVEPVCARRVPRGGRSTVAVLQSAVHLRRCGTRQDASDACDRALRAHASEEPQTDLHLVGAIHERDDQRGQVRPHS